ncbi:GntR family transcriptional regulator [Marmoricola endophyticus]|uniref:GntR family transcriptional regulator n=1 Tax=Marmoricola endophyticus TaxID=2040280 RepID=A0A917F0G9_9ACTN|nr:FCD domain-containing protein [Marmoricola endophyticus]GGF40044.1 GntR family transcriptional regulator [Marmoricola endophyticus]
MTPPTPSLSERIADGIVALIESSGLGPGDPLESSRALAKRFDVTTPTVREALRRLEATDVIRLRHGSGTYIGEGIGRRLLVNPHVAGSSTDSVLELVEARLLLEPPVAAAAALSRSEGAVALLETAADNALKPQHGEERPGLHFHVALAAAAGNRLVRESIEALLQVRSRDQVAIRHHYDDRGRDHAEHVEILTAVRDRDPQAASTLTRDHLTAIRDAFAGLVAEESA